MRWADLLYRLIWRRPLNWLAYTKQAERLICVEHWRGHLWSAAADEPSTTHAIMQLWYLQSFCTIAFQLVCLRHFNEILDTINLGSLLAAPIFLLCGILQLKAITDKVGIIYITWSTISHRLTCSLLVSQVSLFWPGEPAIWMAVSQTVFYIITNCGLKPSFTS